ncbi:hypothetical protein J6590_099521 [Homalodisca vitripennis]|nr:hypothetical protein J6590_099521 [Homalodisca vitripennis]
MKVVFEKDILRQLLGISQLLGFCRICECYIHVITDLFMNARAVTWAETTHCCLAASQHVNVALSSLLRSSDSDDRIMSCKTEEHHKESSDVAKHTAGWPHPNMLTWPCPLYYVLRIQTIVSCRERQKNTTRRAVMWPDTLLAGRIPTC